MNKNNNKIIYLVLGVAAVVIATTFIIRIVEKSTPDKLPPSQQPTFNTITPTINPMVGWKTYMNTKRNYSLQYPQDWTAQEVLNENPLTGKVEHVSFYSPDGNYLLSLLIKNSGEDINSGRTGMPAGDFEAGEPVALGSFQLSTKNLVYEGKTQVISYEGQFDNRDVDGTFDYVGKELIEIDLKNIPEHQTVNKILSTFKFTDQVSDEMMDYTGTDFGYKNSLYSGYTFKYPKNCTIEPSGFFLNCITSSGVAKIRIDAGGHGGGIEEIRKIYDNVTKTYPFGEVTVTLIERLSSKTLTGTYWINKTDKLEQHPIFGFELLPAPVEDLEEYEKIMDQILSTFTFTN